MRKQSERERDSERESREREKAETEREGEIGSLPTQTPLNIHPFEEGLRASGRQFRPRRERTQK